MNTQSPLFAWLILLIVILTALAFVVVPVWIIQPFKPQTDTNVALSYVLRRWSPLVTVISVLLALTLVVWLWRHTRSRLLKVILIIAILPLFPATWFARQNHFEWMFNPLHSPAYVKSKDASFLTDADVLLAVKINGEAAAYPIRLMGYHHLVQDVVGGTPIVATY